MTHTVLMALGATGAKVAEAALHLSVAGLGPRQLSIGFIEQDGLEPNVKRAHDALSGAQRLRKVLREPAPASANEKEDVAHTLSSDVAFGTHRVQPLGALENGLWRPAGAGGALACDLLTQADEARGLGPLVDVLFDAAPGTRQKLASGGFDADAALAATSVALGGAAALERDRRPNSFWGATRQLIETASAATPVRFVVVGGVFEAMGAANLEVLRLLNEVVREASAEAHVDIMTTLVTPYFSDGSLERDALRAAQARDVLNAYARHLEDDELASTAAVVGWSPAFVVQAEEPGRSTQRVSSACDLFAALACIRPWSRDRVEADLDETEVQVTTRANVDRVTWTDVDLASARRDGDPHAAAALARAVSFATHWASGFGEQLREQSKKVMLRERWFKAACPKLRMASHEETEPLFGALDSYVLRLLQWASELSTTAPASDGYAFTLWRAPVIGAAYRRARGLAGGVEASTSLGPEAVIPAEPDAPLQVRSATAIRAVLETAPPPPGASGLGAVVEALFQTSAADPAARPEPADMAEETQ